MGFPTSIPHPASQRFAEESGKNVHYKHSALATHIHRIRAMAHWKAVTGAVA